MSYKWCTVPLCKSTSEVTPGKLFIQVPMNAGTRAKWFKLARREATLSPRTYFCEDHFDLPNDMVNYTRYTTMGSVGRIQLKPGCMPSIFDYEVDQKIQIAQDATHTPVLKRKRLSLIHEVENQWQVDQTPDEPQPGPSIDDSTSNIVSPHLSEYSKPETVSVATQVYMTSTFQSKGTQTSNINMRAVATSPSDVCSLCLEKSNSVLNPLTAVSQLESIYYKNILASDRTDYSDLQLCACDKCLQQLKSFQNFIKTCQSSYEFIKNKSCLKEEQEELILEELHEELIIKEEQEEVLIKELHEEVIIKEEQHDFHSELEASGENDCDETKETEPEKPKKYKWGRNKVCKYCDKKFATPSKLDQHMSVHTGYAPFKCSFCDKTMQCKNDVKAHERIHTGERPFVCSTCNKAFRDSRVLNMHMKMHTGCKEKCEICEKMFRRPAALRMHMRVHTGEAPYKCDKCDKAYPTASSCKYHMATHSDDRSFVCQQCGSAFKRRANLRIHEATHTDEKSFCCNLCDFACRSPFSLKRHVKNCHC